MISFVVMMLTHERVHICYMSLHIYMACCVLRALIDVFVVTPTPASGITDLIKYIKHDCAEKSRSLVGLFISALLLFVGVHVSNRVSVEC